MKKELKKAYSVWREESAIETLRELSEEWGLTPSDLKRLAVMSLIKEAQKNKGEIKLPFRHESLKKLTAQPFKNLC